MVEDASHDGLGLLSELLVGDLQRLEPGDPLLEADHVDPPAGVDINLPDQRSASELTVHVDGVPALRQAGSDVVELSWTNQ